MARTATSRKRRRGRPVPPGLEGEVGEEAIARELGEAAAQDKPPAAAPPEPPKPPEPDQLLASLAGDVPPSPLKTPIQALFAAAGGLEHSAAAARKAKPEDLWKLPDWEANLYGRCAELALARRQLTLEKYAEWVLLLGLGGRILFNLWLLKKSKAPAAAPAPPPAPPPAAA